MHLVQLTASLLIAATSALVANAGRYECPVAGATVYISDAKFAETMAAARGAVGHPVTSVDGNVYPAGFRNDRPNERVQFRNADCRIPTPAGAAASYLEFPLLPPAGWIFGENNRRAAGIFRVAWVRGGGADCGLMVHTNDPTVNVACTYNANANANSQFVVQASS